MPKFNASQTCKKNIDKQTFSTSIELHPHGNMSVPAPRMNFNVLGFDSRKKSMLNNAVLISISLEVLKERTACKEALFKFLIFSLVNVSLSFKTIHVDSRI